MLDPVLCNMIWISRNFKMALLFQYFSYYFYTLVNKPVSSVQKRFLSTWKAAVWLSGCSFVIMVCVPSIKGDVVLEGW